MYVCFGGEIGKVIIFSYILLCVLTITAKTFDNAAVKSLSF